MNVYDAVQTRRSVRGFLDRPVPDQTMRRILQAAARAPSGGNLQPWHVTVVTGAALQRLKDIMRDRVQQAPDGETAEDKIYPDKLVAPYRDRRFKVGEDLYGHLDIPREDKAARKRWFAENYQFFGAPMALFVNVHRMMGPPQWSDLGMFMQTVMLLLREEGLDSCAQECWAVYPETMGAFLNTPPEQMLFSGMAIGYADPDAPANRLAAAREDVEAFAAFIDR
jgi:nitroreductase